MNALTDFLKKHNHWILFLLLETISLVILFRYNRYQGSVWFTQANTVAAEGNGAFTLAESYLHLDQVNRHLTHQNTVLQAQVNQLRERLADATRETDATEQEMLDTLSGYKIYDARVVSSSIIKNENYIVIDKGSADGIKPEMGVVGGGGVVGVVYICNSHHSLVLPLINVKSSISCRLRRSQYYGTLKWNGGSVLHADLVDVPQHAKAKPGDVVETSGYSTIFPPGRFVGRVSKVSDTADGLSQQLRVNLGTDFGNLRDVSVFENLYKADIQGLHDRLNDDNEKD